MASTAILMSAAFFREPPSFCGISISSTWAGARRVLSGALLTAARSSSTSAYRRSVRFTRSGVAQQPGQRRAGGGVAGREAGEVLGERLQPLVHADGPAADHHAAHHLVDLG